MPMPIDKLYEYASLGGAVEIAGTITKAHDIKSGENAHGPWRFRNIVINDGSTQEARVQWYGCSEAPYDQLVGQPVTVSGILLERYKEDRAELKAKKTTDIQFESPGPGPASAAPSQAQAAAPISPSSGQGQGGSVSKRTDVEVLALVGQWRGVLVEAGFTDDRAIAACINTLLIAINRGEIRVEEPDLPF